MFEGIPVAAWPVLACSQCGAPLKRSPDEIGCSSCGTRFPGGASGALDLRLQRPKAFSVEFPLGTPVHPEDFEFGTLKPHPSPQVHYDGNANRWNLSPTLMSYFPLARRSDSLALDLGCGTGYHRQACEQAGFQWVGLDYDAPEAPILGDGHALPFADSSFEFVLSMAVMEHIRYPFVVASEVLRVLKPGGWYVGTVSFLEPFHGNSFYHHTCLGTYNTLATAGFDVHKVAPDPAWSGLRAQANMAGLFPKMPQLLGRALVWPLEALSKIWWRTARLVEPKATETTRLVTTTGVFQFIACKPDR